MTLRPLSEHNSLPQNLGQVNDMIRTLNKEQQTKVFKGPNQVNSVISGKLPNDLGYGIQFSDTSNIPRIIAYIDENNNPIFKISESGVDVTTADDDELIFNSAQNVFKVVATGTISITVPDPFTSAGSPLVGTYVHALGYRPALMVFGDIPSGSGAYSGTGSLTNLPVIVGGSGQITVMAQAAVDTTTLYIRIINMLGANIVGLGTPWVFKYYLLQETAN